MPARGWLRRAGKFLNPGVAGLLFILFFIILFAIIAPIALRIGKLFVESILWVYESRNYSVGLSLIVGLIIVPAVVAAALAWLLRRRGRRVVPAIMANEWFWVFAAIYVVVITALPVMSPTAAAVLLSLNTPMIIAAPLIFITAFDLARDFNEGSYWVAAEAYIALFTALLFSDLATALMAGVATEITHLFTKASLIIGGYGAMDGLVLIPTEAAIAALITVVAVRHLDVLKVVFKNALVDVGLSVLLITGVLLGLGLIPYNLAGPVFGAAITLFATGLNNVTNYLSTTTTLSHELDIECRSDDCSKGWIIIRIKNTGKNVAEDAYALVSIRARREGTPSEEGYLGIEDESLPWLSSGSITTKVSIDPGHSSELLVFEYERAPDGYVIKVPSEGSVDKPRARLWLDFDTKYVFRIKVDGKSVRLPLDIKLYITMNKLDAIASSKTMFREAYINEVVLNVAREVFNIVFRELGNDRGIAERAATLRERIFIPKSSNIEGYLRIANGFETLYNELRNQFGWLAEYLGLVFGVSYEYAVYLALAKRWDELASLIESIRFNLSSLSRNDDVYVMTKLLLNLITDEKFREKFSDWLTGGNIYDTLRYYVPKHLRPALARLLNYGQITCKSACGYDEEEECSNQCCKNCERMLNALKGDENVVKDIVSDLDSVLRRHRAYKNWVGGSSKEEKSAPPMLIKEIIDYVHNNKEPQDWGFFSRAVVELRLPTTSRLRFILILHDLLRAREEFERGNIDGAVKFVDLAEAHAVIGNIKYRGRIPSLSVASHFFISVEILTSDLKSKLKGSRRFEISDIDILILLRLYHYHVQTNLAETWP